MNIIRLKRNSRSSIDNNLERDHIISKMFQKKEVKDSAIILILFFKFTHDQIRKDRDVEQMRLITWYAILFFFDRTMTPH